ncbi:MAG TPA: hypothetical protein VGK56_14595 [Anaerolineales bacterium]
MDEILKFIGEWLLGAAAFLVILFVLMTAVYSLRRRALRRRRRHAQQHQSTFPYRPIFYVSVVLTLCACGLSAYLMSRPDGPGNIVFLPALPLLLAAWSFRGYVLQKMPSAAEAIEQDPRPPVLYLRSFDQENLIFVVLKDQAKFNDLLLYADDIQLPAFERLIYRLSNWLLALLGWDSARIQNITFEKYFRTEVTQRIGPLIALGNPIDSLPAEGAFRDYQIDEGWKDIFYERSSRGACILMQLGSSNNLQFELVSIVERGMRHKLFILTQPQARVYDVMAPARKYVLREKPADWRTFSEILRVNGYQVPQEDLGLGAVLTFEPDGQPLILKRGAFQPEEYIGPIHERLRQLNLVPEDEKPAGTSSTTLE